jgi:hypothetical protein
MLKLNKKLFAVPIGFALAALLALPMAVLGNTSGAIAQTGGMTVTLPVAPLLGGPLTVEVKLDGVGNVSQVNLTPIGTGTAAYSATKLGAHAVTFTRADGATQVSIKAKGDKLSVKASAGTLDGLLGAGTWSAYIFATGTKSTVAYTVGKAADGTPTIAVTLVTPAAGITVVQDPPRTETEDHEASASVRVTFSANGYTRKLSISVSVDTEGTHKASLKITLSGKDRQKLSGTLAEIGLGLHTWSGALCDGKAVGIRYNVLDTGTVAFVDATGGTTTVKSGEHGFSVRFDGTKARVKVSLQKADDGTWTLKVEAKTGECKNTPAPLPTVNTPVAPGADKAGDHDKKPDPSGSHDGNGKGNGKDGH